MKHTTILQLTVRMGQGYGASVVVEELSRQFMTRGHRVIVGCAEKFGTIPRLDVRVLPADPAVLRGIVEREKIDVVIAYATPFFEMLPWLRPFTRCIAAELGDPTPDLFPDDAEARVAIKAYKQQQVYPVVDGVVAISEFIRHDIDWPRSAVVSLGIDHVPDWGLKSSFPERCLKVGTLMRLGKGEHHYKGTDEFLELAARLKRSGVTAEFIAAGRGSHEDAQVFERAGVRTLRNLSDHDKYLYLRSLDLFISCSLWEGFNLPLAEAQALGTLALAFDTGAHPEVTPYVCARYEDAMALIDRCHHDREFLSAASLRCYRYVRKRFRWSHTADRMLGLCGVAEC